MKSGYILSAMLGLFFLLVSPSADACIQKLKPEKSTVKVGETVKISASIKWIHHPCELDTDDIKLKFTGVKKLSMSKWKKKGKGKYLSEIKVKILNAKAMIEMWRVCSKSGKHGTKLKFKVVK
ncbi:MAG: hypothetical protein JXR95_04455 [Deltaproteobacteria bacterium]|nr:hypothetical protein [Deltaproteobacteria bacterium]